MKTAALVLAFMCFSSSAFANDSVYNKHHMEPLESERLAQPINLTGICSFVQVVEWRPTQGYEAATDKSERSLKAMNRICELAVSNFKIFVLQQNYVLNKDFSLYQSISLIPANSEVRNLNDASYRFFHRYKELDNNGVIIPIWGYHSRSSSHIYIRNDVYNLTFKTVFAHELFHAMSYQSGIFQQHAGDQNLADEQMARQFTKFLHLGE